MDTPTAPPAEAPTPNIATVDALATLASQRNYFDLPEVEGMVRRLHESHVEGGEYTAALIQRCRDRKYVSGDAVMDAMLDLRNEISPPRSYQEVDEAPTPDPEPEPTATPAAGYL
jgi:hypothetical protein